MNPGNRLLIVGPNWVGDVVMAQSLFSLLRQRQPALHITVLAPAWSRALLDRMPEVDQSLELPFSRGELRFLERRRFGRRLIGQFDRAILLPNSFKSALVPFFARIPERTGWRGEHRNLLLTDCRVLDESRYPLMVQRFAALGLEPDASLGHLHRPRLTVGLDAARETAAGLGLVPDRPVLAICPGAEYGDAKQWPAEHFASLADRAVDAGWQVWMLGSSNDRRVCEEIVALVAEHHRRHCLDLAGLTTLDQAIDLLSLVAAMVTNDSGLMHIGAALQTPLVALFGSTSTDFTPPLSDRVKSLSTDIACRPCFARTCPLGHRRCLTEITPERVYSAVQELLVS